MEQSGVKASGEKRDISEQRENIREREKIHAKTENKSVVIRSERRVRKDVWIIAEQAVYYITTQIEEKIRPEKIDKQQRRSTRNDGK